MRVGVIGTGKIAYMICPHLREWGIEVGAICSTPRSSAKARELAGECGLDPNTSNTLFTDQSQMLAQADVDTVYVALPNHLHYAATRQALESGKNVICEKPLTSNDREAQELSRLARQRGLYLWEAISTLYMPNYLQIRDWLPRIGQVRVVAVNYSQYSSRYDAFRSGQVLPAFDPAKSGGALMDLGIYCLHFVVGLFGEPRSCTYAANVQRGIDTSGVALLDYGDFKASVIAAKDCAAPTLNVIEGQDGYIATQTPPNVLEPVTLHLNDGTTQTYDVHPDQRWECEFRSFQANIANGADGLAHCYQMLDESLATMRLQTRLRLDAGVRFPADDQ